MLLPAAFRSLSRPSSALSAKASTLRSFRLTFFDLLPAGDLVFLPLACGIFGLLSVVVLVALVISLLAYFFCFCFASSVSVLLVLFLRMHMLPYASPRMSKIYSFGINIDSVCGFQGTSLSFILLKRNAFLLSSE